MGYNYTLDFEPHDEHLSVTDRASGRTSDFVWGQAKELMYLIANGNNISRENLIHNEVMRDTGFVDGKFRVEDFYRINPEKKDFVDFLKKEYGIGGHSGEGPVRFSDHDSKGIEITLTTGKENFTWAEVAKTISDLIEKGEYITQKDIDERIRRAQIIIDNANENTDFTDLIRAHEILQKYGIEKPQQDNEYKIYQLKSGPENHAIRFEEYSLAEKHGEPANPENYDLVYSGSLDDFEDSNKLEAIYNKFNIDCPEDFKGHSLSVSDIIVMNDEAHYVDSFGFVDVSDKFLGKEKEPININEYDTIRLVRRIEWNDRDLSDAENPAFEEITASYSPDEDGSYTKYETNKTNSINVDVSENENSVSAENMLSEIEEHLKNMRSGVSSKDYHIELVDHDGNTRKLDNHYFTFVQEDVKVKEKAFETEPESVDYDDIYDLAVKLDNFIYDYDTYGYMDNMEVGETREDAVKNIVSNIMKGTVSGYLPTLNDIITDCGEETDIVSRAKELAAAITAITGEKMPAPYEPYIGDLVEKNDELFRISNISDNIITLEETASLFHESESITLADFMERGYSVVEAAERKEKVQSLVGTEGKSPLDTQADSHSDKVESPVDTRNNNFVITDENLGVNGPKARFNANVAAVETLKKYRI